jgi:hypothetical protein
MNNIKEYSELEFKKSFENNIIAQRIKSDFDELVWDKFYELYTKTVSTPRQSALRLDNAPSRFSMAPFYYIQYLLDKNPQEIYDLGCGLNIFKRYIPNIVGVSPETIESGYYFGDIHDFIDDDYIKNHANYFESVFAINSLHFYPIEMIRQRVLDFASMIKTNGRGFITLNLARMVDASESRAVFYQNNFDFDKFVRNELKDMPLSFLVFDVDLAVLNAGMDGNVRLVIEKKI